MKGATLQLLGVLLLVVRGGLGDVVCPEVPAINGGRVEYPPSRTVGTVLQYLCNGHTRPHPVGSRVCMPSGSWSPLRNVYYESARGASCEPYSCVGPFTLPNGRVYPQKAKYKVGEVVRFECQDEYAMFGSPNRTCLPNGEWSGRTTICDMGDTFCPNPGSPVGGQRLGARFGRGDEVRYTCFNGLVLRGSALRTCQGDGQWSGKEPRCEGRYSNDDPERVAESLSLFEEITEHAQSGSRIYFLLDASGSVGEVNFEKAKDFVLHFATLAKDISKDVKSTVITFASNTHIVTNRTFDTGVLQDALKKWKYSDASNQGGTNTGGALQEVLDDIKKDKKEELPKIFVILVTDGKHNTGRSPYELVQEIAAAIPDAERMLDIFSIGIGDAHKEDLEKIASKKEPQRAFYLQDYGTLGLISEAMNTIETSMKEPGNSVQCGVRGGPSMGVGRIYKGQEVKDKQWPWQVLVTSKSENSISGGSIISQCWILTAAHVVMVSNDIKDIPVDDIVVTVGDTNRSKGQRLSVEKVIVHERYIGQHGQRHDYNYDIALLKLKENLTFTNKIWPVCLPCTEEMNGVLSLPQVSEEEKCEYQDRILTGHGGDQEKKIRGYVTGWGHMEKKVHPMMLIHAEITIQTRVNCSKFVKAFTENMICAIGEEGRDSCAGDSGGPFVVRMNQRWIQVGIVSHGTSGKCGKSTVGIYTSIPKMMDWIISKVGKTGLN